METISRFLITVTIRIVGFCAVPFTLFLLSHLPLLRDSVSGSAVSSGAKTQGLLWRCVGLWHPCPALRLRPEQREQRAYLIQITLSKLPGPVLFFCGRGSAESDPVGSRRSLGHMRLPGVALLASGICQHDKTGLSLLLALRTRAHRGTVSRSGITVLGRTSPCHW